MAGYGLPGTAFERLRRALARGIAGVRRCRCARRAAPLRPVLHAGLTLAVEALAAGLVGIRRIAAVGRVVLPGRSIVVDVVAVDALVDVDVVVAVDVDVDVVMPPVEPAPHGVDRSHAQAEADAGHQRGGEHRARRRRIVVRRIGGIGPGAVHHRRVVAGHVHHLRIGRLDHHDGLVVGGAGGDLLLRRALQVAGLLRLDAQPLDRIHDGVGLRQEGVAHGFHPVRLAAHHVHDRGEGHQGFDAGIPGLALDRLDGLVSGFRGVGGRPFGGRRDIVGVGRTHEDLREQRIRIQRHGRHQLIQLRVVQLGLRRGGKADRQPQA
ncbi:hypothetical protein LMG3410_03259 [Achromobacter aegrifaciens]|nr:hypothetical protein LMG3410_03259 [Achromobacter aegrifaciens]